MRKKVFMKILSANDVGATGSHQAGMHVPKSDAELLDFLPSLDLSIKNPESWINCIDEHGSSQKFRFVYYNNKLHDKRGTRNEYRITCMTNYFREIGAQEDDTFEISREEGDAHYAIRIIPRQEAQVMHKEDQPTRIKIRTGWRQAH